MFDIDTTTLLPGLAGIVCLLAAITAVAVYRVRSRANIEIPQAIAPSAGEEILGLVLVAEDNSVNQLVTMTQLKKLGFLTQVVANGKEAVELYQSSHFDLILMDYHMPEMDGLDATRAIRAFEKTNGKSHIPIIALTANVMEEDKKRCFEAGMDDYLSKPVSKEDLQATLSKWLDRKNNQTQKAC